MVQSKLIKVCLKNIKKVLYFAQIANFFLNFGLGDTSCCRACI